MQITAIPGFSSEKAFHSNYNKPQRFVFRNGLPIEEDAEKKAPKVPAADRLLGRNPFKDSTAPVLKFDAYYLHVHGERNNQSQFRQCYVLYYLADDEIKVYEPRQKNSGLDQGCIVRKGRFYKPEGGYYTVDDLNIGETLVLNGREFKLIKCDPFTRKFLTEMGYKIRSPEPNVEDPLTLDREEENVPKSYRKPYVKDYKYKRFFQHHPKRLCFFGVHGEGKNLFDEKREVTLYYDLSSRMIKIVEERCKNKWIDGRRDTRLLLRSTLVPKVLEPSLLIGEMCDQTLLNQAFDVQNVLIGEKYYKIQNPNSYLVDPNPLEGRRKVVEYYTDKDLDLGIILNIFGSNVFLYDCDDFTKNYYRSVYNKELKPIPRPDLKPFHYHKLIYKHEMFGEPEQTIRTNDPFTPIRYMSDLKKFFTKDRYAYDVKELKFLAQCISEDPVEKLRTFLVKWYMEDDTMEIKAVDLDFGNTSIMEHKFLQRMKVLKPRSSEGNFERCYYKPTDMFVGNIIYIRGKAYALVEADEYTYDYMERNCHLFLHSNVKRIVTTLRPWIKENYEAVKTGLEKRDPSKTECVNYDGMKTVLYGLMTKELQREYPEHALKTLARHYAVEKYVGLRVDDLASKIRTELYRMKFYDFEDLKAPMEIQDEDKLGYLTPKRLYFALRSAPLPIHRDLLKSFIYKFPTKDGKIKFLDLLHSIDWLKNNTQYEKQDTDVVNINWEHKEHEKDLEKIKYYTFLSDVMLH